MSRAIVDRDELKREVEALRTQGKTIVFTGELRDLDRKEAEGIVRELGGNATSSVSKNTDFVVVGENPGSKFKKARSLGIKIIDEKEFKKLVRSKND